MVFEVKTENYGHGKMIWLSTDALRVGVATLGATISSVQVYHPSRQEWIEVNCGFPYNADEALDDTDYMGVTAGRCAGRVQNAKFELDGVVYHTDKNMNGKHTCHGGVNAYHKKEWGYAIRSSAAEISVVFNYTSPHMENGFPAELYNTVTYTVTRAAPNALKSIFHAEVTETSSADATVVNIFNHCYWNLNGVPDHARRARHAQPHQAKTDDEKLWPQPEMIHNHWVKVPASRVATADREAMPNGEFESVEGTPLDFRRGRYLRDGIDDVHYLNRDPCGYDHPLSIDNWERNKLMLNGEVVSPSTNIKMTVSSTYPCMWVYTANNKKLPCEGARGARYGRWSGLGMEPQYYPDNATSYPNFPSCVIRKGQNTFHEVMVNEFSVEKAGSV